MEKKIATLVFGLVLITVNAFAQDVMIDNSGNVTTGTSNTNANLEVIGSSGEDGVVGETSGTASGVYGVNTSTGNFGTLGHLNYGVYGKGVVGSAGFFDGNVNILGNLTLTGSISGAGVGDITQVSAGTGLTGGGTSGAVALGVNFGGTGVLSTVSRSDHNHNTSYSALIHLHSADDITTGTINTARLNVGATSDTVAAGDHTHEGLGGAGYGKVAVVAKSGGDYLTPIDAMNNVASWCGVPSSSNPCLLKVMPGEYVVTPGSLQMQNYVDIEGSGENVTIISGSTNSSSAGVVNGANNAEIRFLTVENTVLPIQYPDEANGIYNDGVSPRISHVTINIVGGYFGRGVYNISSDSVLYNVRINVSGPVFGYGIENLDSNATIKDATIDATGSIEGDGVLNTNSGIIEIFQSYIKGSTSSVSTGIVTLISGSKLIGAVGAPPSLAKCAGVVDVNHIFYTDTCP